MLNEILNYLNTNGGLLVILSVATAYFLSRSFFRQLTPVRNPGGDCNGFYLPIRRTAAWCSAVGSCGDLDRSGPIADCLISCRQSVSV
jgi:hypothetical protein